jgi:Ca-activated chloride channel homolog
MLRFRIQYSFWFFLFVAPSLCVQASFHRAGGEISNQVRYEANSRGNIQSQDAIRSPQSRRDVVKIDTNLVTLNISVTDKDRKYVPGLTPGDFEVYEDGVRQNLTFFSDEDSPLDVGILLDTSTSLKKYFEQSLEAARGLIQTSHKEDQFFFLTFAKKITVQATFADGDRVAEQLRLPEPEGSTAFYDSVYYGIESVKQGRYRKHALLIISDGLENSSIYTYKELMGLVIEAGVQIYCIGIGDTEVDGDDISGSQLLERLAKETGGMAYFPKNPAEIEKAVNHISLLLRHQYSVGYYPSILNGDTKWHKLKVQLPISMKSQLLRVSAKSGYFGRP